MRESSRAIILKDNKILLMFRRRITDGITKEYYVIPGGGRDEGETLEQNVVRELKEEMNIDIKVKNFLGEIADEKSISYYFSCIILGGEVKLSGEELERMSSENYYEPMWVDLETAKTLNIVGFNFVSLV